MHHCGNCDSPLQVARMRCSACGITYEAGFHSPRLARLGADHQRLAEQIVLAAGNLKEVAGTLEISYPTLRKRVDALIEALSTLHHEDSALSQSFLDAVEAGKMAPEEASRRIKELNGGV